MKVVFIAVSLVSLVDTSRGGPSERAILAAMKLSERPNYRWTSTVSDDARTYDVEGKTDRSGYTWLRLPMVKSVAERLGRGAESEIEAVFRGSDAFVIRTEHGWKTWRELPKRNWEWNDDIELWPAPLSARANMGAAARAGLDPLDQIFPPAVMVTPLPAVEEDDRRPYSNAQLALCLPHDELSIIVSSHTALQVDADVATGTLSDIGAALLLVRDGQDQIKPLAAAGVFRFVMKDGVVLRYSLKLEGILLVDRKKIHVHQESSTQVMDVGTTCVQIVDEIRRKLGP